MIYDYWTTEEEYDDGTKTQFLNQKLLLKDLNTFSFKNNNSYVRMSVGWSNPQEDGYDVTSI